MLKFEDIKTRAAALGFSGVGVAPVEPIGGGWFAPHAERVKSWVEHGEHADMEWIAKRLDERVVPDRLLPGVRSAIILWMNHKTPTPKRPDGQVGRVAAYAWGRDYHNVVRKAFRKLERWMFQESPALRRYVSIDTGAILERAFGERSSVGWIGRSTMLINPELGTFGSLAVMFIDQDFPIDAQTHPFRCGHCVDCITACPTGALTEGRLDARKCISYWTIEHRGLIPVEMRSQLGDWVFGCDICQDVCPWNNKAPRADPEIWKPKSDHAWPDLVDWLKTPADELNDRFLGSPLRRAGGQGLRRNALIVLANTKTVSALDLIESVAVNDPDPVIRATAVWAAHSMGSIKVLAAARGDGDPMVRAEVRTK
ncbi:MAG: tRNA epoxyqueuosine(34) reductase QueG [Myxococcales bacterium]|nr:tRNA epoxyqueuosine(34) reductase QueG [Myxococcales bacterium]